MDYTLKDLASADIKRGAAKGVTSLQVTTYTIHWKHLCAFFGEDCPLDGLRYERLLDYVEHRRSVGRKGQTVRKELQTLKRGLGLARRMGWLSAVPDIWPEIRSDPRDRKRAGKLHPIETVQKWLDLLPDYIRDELMFALLTGLRSGEERNCRPEWVRPAPPGSPTPLILEVPAGAGKNKSASRIVGLGPEAIAIVKRAVARGSSDGTLFGPGDRKSCWNRARERLGYPVNITKRDLRHMYSTWALEGTGDAKAVMAAMGHNDLATTNFYQSSTISRTASASAVVEIAASSLTARSLPPPIRSLDAAKKPLPARLAQLDRALASEGRDPPKPPVLPLLDPSEYDLLE